ncbi:MAG: sulfite exporter TauE/SafE family protein [Nitrospiraceae bacterium]
MSTDQLVLVGITLFAATVNGALGYGFSSLTVPVALLFYTNRILNPALVLVEVVINGYVLLINRRSVPHVWKRVVPMLFGVLLGVMIGSYTLSLLHPGWLKFFTYFILLPLILFQAAGVRRPIRSEKLIGVPFGMGIGTLYSVTTISGPPLALLFNNQGYAKQDFRAAISVIRVAESTLTSIAYYFLGLYSIDSAQLLPFIVPSVLVGIPLGTYLISQMNSETFRRLCMSFDAIVVGFGMSKVLIDLKFAPSPEAYSILATAVAIDAYLLFRFFRGRTVP